MDTLKYFIILIHVLPALGASIQEQLDHISRRQQESLGVLDEALGPTRRKYFEYDPHDVGHVIGAPSLSMHLPAAEPILPGHTLIRPALGMLKSSVKFPHREMDNGAGVYGNYNTLGIRYDGRNERVKYTDFRRSGGDGPRRSLADYILIAPTKSLKTSRPGFSLANLALDMNRKRDAELRVLKLLDKLRKPVGDDVRLIMYIADPRNSPLNLEDLYKEDNNEIDKEPYQSEEIIIPQTHDKKKENKTAVSKSYLIQIFPNKIVSAGIRKKRLKEAIPLNTWGSETARAWAETVETFKTVFNAVYGEVRDCVNASLKEFRKYA